MWQLGWLSPQTINKLSAGQTLTLTISAQTRSSSSGVRIITSSWAPGSPNVYLGYRLAEGADAGLGASYAGKTNVYTSSTADSYDPQYSSWLAGVSTGERYTEVRSLTMSGLVIPECLLVDQCNRPY